jgi:DNA gyrase/topoisomerase IV subunit B
MAHAPFATISHASLAHELHAHSESHYRALCEQLRVRGIGDFATVRYRGLAGIDLRTLAATCVAPATRTLRALSIADAEAALAVFGGAGRNSASSASLAALPESS